MGTRQNTSSAVMQQRSEPHDSLDDFPTPPWATRALIEHVLLPNLRVPDPRKHMREKLTCWEPACNRGHMARPLAEYFSRVHASDIHDYRQEWPGQERLVDFLFNFAETLCLEPCGVDWVITNPPFRLAEQFIHRAWRVTGVSGVAMLVRTSFLEGVGRYENLFKVRPPSIVAQFVERVPMVKGRLTATGSTATSYCWLVWMTGELGTRLEWIPPCRKQLERSDDYEVAA
ncbi:methyltransferase [Rhodoligotrophos ferricapiens]|uniref:methyltransferase n=1 Tax=Rhodoligotrophos ferricapiens TaxID=3069264 RepID=UPI00315D3667